MHAVLLSSKYGRSICELCVCGAGTLVCNSRVPTARFVCQSATHISHALDLGRVGWGGVFVTDMHTERDLHCV